MTRLRSDWRRLDDAKRLWSWRNDPDTRRASYNTDAITLDQYTRWFERALLRNDTILLIAELLSEAIGTIRFDKRRDSYFEGQHQYRAARAEKKSWRGLSARGP